MIFLATDFGLAGPYQGQVKAVLARCAPAVPVADLFADLPPFAPKLAAYLLAAYVDGLAPGDVMLAVVDPGVGSERQPLAIEADGRWLVGPDNGLLELIRRRAASVRIWRIAWRPERLAPTFHGRDLFAPVAAALALGERPPLEPGQCLPCPDWPDDLPAVVYVDHYGNAMTGLRAERLAADAALQAGGQRLTRARYFAERPPGAPFWYANANGLAEIAVNGGSAAAALGLAPGSPIGL
jgi:hypothetical protein